MGRAGRLLVVALLLPAAPLAALAAGPDNNVEWNGISHISWQDRRPVCPIDGQPFEVRFQTYADDITTARVNVNDGTVAWIDAVKTAARGPYDVWAADIPATAAPTLSYYVELTDGTDTDYLGADGMSPAPPGSPFEIDYTTLEHAPVGATPAEGGGTVFRVWAPTRTSVHVRGQFNGWGLTDALTKVGEDFIGYVDDADAREMYKYYFNPSHWNTDARAKALNPGDNYNSYIEDPFSYDWQVDDFDVPDFEEMVVYQLHVGTFAGRNDPYGSAPFPARYVDVAARARHLADLGINAVMLNPITEFPWDFSAGYNPITAWAPESVYGTPDDLKYMVDVLHQHGIAVILDIVWNHFSYSDNYLWYYDGTQIYFDDPAVETPWGSQADFDREPVRDYFAESAHHWLGEYRMDGFRMDATSYMNIEPQEASGWSLMQRMNDEMDNRYVDKIAIAEQLPDNPWVTRPTNLGGAGFDSQYFDAFTDRLREEIFDAATGNPEMWKIRDIVNGGGQYLEGRYVTNYVELHDEAWPSSGGQRIVKTIDTTFPHDDEYARGRVKLANGVVFAAPGIPAMLMGGEWLEDTDFGTDSGNRIDWSKKTTYASVFAYFRDLITFRRLSAALRADAGREVLHLNESGNVIAWQRWGGGEVVVAVANFSNTDYGSYRIGLPQPGEWREELNSQATEYGGSGTTNPGTLVADAIPQDGYSQSIEIAVPRMGFILLSHGDGVGVPEDPVDVAGSPRLFGASPNPFNPRATIRFEIPERGHVRITVYDVAGRRVATLADRAFEAGASTVLWDGTTDGGTPVASGVYHVMMETGGAAHSAKAVLLR